jgi:integrase
VRVSELVQIEVGDVDLEACKIFINRGKGAKDRYILFPASASAWCSRATCTPHRAIDIYSRLGGLGRSRHAESSKLFKATAAPASVPPSDADLPDVQRPGRRTDSADFRPRKQKEPRGLPTLSLESVDKAYRMRSRAWGSKEISVGLYVPLLG